MKTLFVLISLLSTSGALWSQIPDSVRVFEWEELTDSISSDTVYAISFRKMKLEEVPAGVHKYTNVRYLDFGKNKLTKLPTYFGQFDQLIWLNLERNEFSALPPVICQLKTLTHLILNQNELERLPQCIEYAEMLQYIDLYDNPFRELPESFERLSNLKKVDFSGIKFGPTFQQHWTSRMPNVDFVFEEPCECME